MADPDKQVEPAPRPGTVQNGSLIGITYPNNSDENWWTLLGERLPTYPEDVQKYAHLRLTPDGSSLVYVDNQARVVMTSLRDGSQRTLADCPEQDYCDASLSPDGQLLAFAAPGGLRIQRVGATTSELLAVEDADFTGSPSWSPDGSEIAFSTEDGVYVAAPDGSDLRQLHQFTPRSWYFVPVRWSPDGSRIAFFDLERLPDTGSSVARYDVRFTAMVVRPDGSDLRALHHAGRCFCTVTPQPNLAWSPDSELLAVTTALGGGRGVYLVRPDGSGWEEIFGGDIASMAWQPVVE
jgi:Tol biopolymer transport system component